MTEGNGVREMLGRIDERTSTLLERSNEMVEWQKRQDVDIDAVKNRVTKHIGQTKGTALALGALVTLVGMVTGVLALF